MKKRTYARIQSMAALLYLGLWLAPAMANAQTLGGTIKDKATGRALEGAMIKLPDSTVVYTGKNGSFLVHASSDSLWVKLQLLGYRPRSLYLKKGVQELFLSPMPMHLEEVVVNTGYDHSPAARRSGSFSVIDRETLQEQVGTDLIGRLEAVGNAVQVNRNSPYQPQLQVRGLSTINGPKGPLIVVDNFPYEGNLDDLNPNEVESISILKDAAATSIWGARAGNGVIVVTTRRARAGQALHIDFRAVSSIQDRPDLMGLRWMGSPDFIQAEQFLYAQGFYDGDLGSTDRPPISPVVELLDAEKKGKIAPTVAASKIAALAEQDYRKDLMAHFYDLGIKQQYYASADAAEGALAWHAALGYDRNLGVLHDRYQRLNMVFAPQLHLKKGWDIGLSVNYTGSRRKSGNVGYTGLNTARGALYPYAALTDGQGRAIAVQKDYRQAYLDTAGHGLLEDWNYYPLNEGAETRQGTFTEDARADASLSKTFSFGLRASLKYRYEQQKEERTTDYQKDSYYARNLVNLFTQIDPVTNELSYGVPPGAILQKGYGDLKDNQLRLQLDYDHRFGEFQLHGFAGGEIRDAVNRFNGGRLYGYDPELLLSSPVDYTQPYPTYITGYGAFIQDGTELSLSRNRFVSVYANGSVTFDDRYIATASVRRDASNLFGVSTNNRWKPLWSVGLGWIASREPFFKSGLIPYLKIRGSFGYSGNADPSRAAVTTIRIGSVSPYVGSPYATFSNFGNPDLRWENVAILNLGVDFRIRNAVSGSLEYYHKNAQDLLGFYPIDPTDGIGSTVTKNIGAMEADGADLELHSKNLPQRAALRWNTDLNFSYSANHISKYYLASDNAVNIVGGTQPMVTGLEGKPVNSIYAYRWAGLDPQTGDPQGYADGKISEDYTALVYGSGVKDLEYIGSADPIWYGTFSNMLAFGRLSLTVALSYKFGYYFRKDALSYTDLFYFWRGNADYAQRWQQPGDEDRTQVPSLSYPANSARDAFYGGSEVNVLKGDQIRLQYINLAYTVPSTFSGKLHLNNCQVFANAAINRKIWTANKEGIDPDFRYTHDVLPPSTVYSFGVKAQF